MKRIKRIVMGIVFMIVGIFVGLAAFLFFVQEKMIYFPRSYDSGLVDDFVQLGGKRLEFATSQGAQAAYLIHNGDWATTERVWLVFGGNGARSLDWVDFLLDYRSDGKEAFLMIEYPGYGECAGRPSPDRILESTRAAVAACATEIGVSEEELTPKFSALGHSLGAAAALQAAEAFAIQDVVIASPFTSTLDMAKRMVGKPLCFILRHNFDNRARLAALKKSGAKVRIFHGESDRQIPVGMSEQLAAQFPQMVTLTKLPNVTHNDIFVLAQVEIEGAMRGEGK